MVSQYIHTSALNLPVFFLKIFEMRSKRVLQIKCVHLHLQGVILCQRCQAKPQVILPPKILHVNTWPENMAKLSNSRQVEQSGMCF